MSKKLTPMVGLLLASILLAFPQTPPQGPAQDRSAELQDLVSRASPHKVISTKWISGRIARALATFNRASFFLNRKLAHAGLVQYAVTPSFSEYKLQIELRKRIKVYSHRYATSCFILCQLVKGARNHQRVAKLVGVVFAHV